MYPSELRKSSIVEDFSGPANRRFRQIIREETSPMDREFKNIYSALYSLPSNYPPRAIRSPQSPLYFEEELVIRSAIEHAETGLSERGQRLRADARYFLLVNISEMIILPIQMRGNIPMGIINDMLRDDVNSIVNAAVRIEPEARRFPEISGHAVLEAIATTWKNLKLTELRVWGED